MSSIDMVPLTDVPSEFAGRVLVAKLGSAGILAEVRGVSRVYPSLLGEPSVWVEAESLSEAHELITTEVEVEFAADDSPPPPASWVRPVLVAVAICLLAVLALLAFQDRPTVSSSRSSSVPSHI